MLFFSYLFLLPLIVLGKEKLSLSQLLDDPDILIDLEKRLGISEDSSPNSEQNDLESITDSVGNKCQYSRQNNRIIKTNASLEKGAIYLKSLLHQTYRECVKVCCYTQRCTTAIFEDKDKNTCYLFDCSDDKCEFAEHKHYQVMTLPVIDSKQETSKHQSVHEDELMNLDSENKDKASTTTTSTTTTTTPKPKIPVKLYGSCHLADKCQDEHATCWDERCMCKDGYHVKYGSCRQVCGSQYFECENREEDRNAPDCINLASVCDGTPQCADGSDETECKEKPAGSHTAKDQDYYKDSNHVDIQQPSRGRDGSHVKHINKQKLPQQIPQVSAVEDTHKPGSPLDSQETEQHIDESPQTGVDKNVENKKKPSLNKEESVVSETTESPVQDKSVLEEDKESTDTAASSEDSSQKHDDSNEDKKEPTGEPAESKVSDKSPNVSAPIKDSLNVKIEEIVIDRDNSMVSNKGPIIALSLGLALTVILLVFIGCRLRNMKKRLRRGGKVLHAHEADYLINGMYL